MTQDEKIEMAKQAGFWKDLFAYPEFKEHLEVFTKLVEERTAAKEREACANLCEDQTQEYYSDGSKRAMNYQCADAIRARGEPTSRGEE